MYGIEIVFASNDSTYNKVTGDELKIMFEEYMDESESYFHVGKTMIKKVNDKGKKWVKQIIVESL